MGGDNAGHRHLVSRRYDHATVFCCLPLRSAVVLVGLGCSLLGLALLTSKASVQEAFRPMVGGYTPTCRTIIGILEAWGLILGIVGAAGAFQMKASWLQLFLTYQIVRLVAWLPMYYMDVPLLWNCELWMSDLQKAEQRYGWNDVIFNVALNNRCGQERSAFAMYSFPSFLFFLYCTSVTQQLLTEIETEPRHCLKGDISGAFYTRSLAARSIAKQIEEEQAQRRKEEKARRKAHDSMSSHRQSEEVLDAPPFPSFEPPGQAAMGGMGNGSKVLGSFAQNPVSSYPSVFATQHYGGASQIYDAATSMAPPSIMRPPTAFAGATEMDASPAPMANPYAMEGGYQTMPAGGRSPPMPGPPQFPSAPARVGIGSYGADGMRLSSAPGPAEPPQNGVPGMSLGGGLLQPVGGTPPGSMMPGMSLGGGLLQPVGGTPSGSMMPVQPTSYEQSSYVGPFCLRPGPQEFRHESVDQAPAGLQGSVGQQDFNHELL